MEARLRSGRFKCECWEVEMSSDQVESLLAEARSENPDAVIQAFGAVRPPNPKAVAMMSAQTLASLESGSMIAERREVDLLLRLAGTRQIGEAFRRAGYRSGKKRLFIVAAWSGAASEPKKLRSMASNDTRFRSVPESTLDKKDFDAVERAALLAGT